MELLIASLVIMIGFTVLGLAGIAFGVDSRDESSDPRRSAYPVGID